MQLTKNTGEACASPFIDRSDYFIMAGLFMVSLLVWGPNVHYGHAYMFVVIGLVALAVMTKNIIIAAFGLYASVWFAYIYAAAFLGIIPDEAVMQSIDTLVFIAAGLAVYSIVKNGKTSARKYMNAICLLSIILSIIGLIQYFYGQQAARATLGNQNFLAAFLAISSPLFLRKKWWVALPVIALAIHTAHTSTAIIALFVGLGFYFWKLRGAVIATIPGLLYYAIIDNHSLLQSERYSFWLDAVNKISNQWNTIIFGVGPGIYWQPGNMLHSEYVYLVFNFGIIGLLLAAAFICKTFAVVRVPNRHLLAAFVIIVVDCIGNHLFHTAPTAMLAIVIIALMGRDKKMEATHGARS